MNIRKWIGVFGFWWSVLVLVYSTRTVQELAAPLWAHVGVDLAGQAVIPLAFFLFFQIGASFGPLGDSVVAFLGFFASLFVATFLGMAFAADQYQLQFVELLRDQERALSPMKGMMIGAGAGISVGLVANLVRLRLPASGMI